MTDQDDDSRPIRIPIERFESSSVLWGAGYDTKRSILAVQMKHTLGIYHYAGVPLSVALEFATCDSKGQFYNKEIRGKYQGLKMTGPCPACGDTGWIGSQCQDCGMDMYHDERLMNGEGEGNQEEGREEVSRRAARTAQRPTGERGHATARQPRAAAARRARSSQRD